MNRAIEAKEVSFSYEGKGPDFAVSGASLYVEKGEFVSLIGPNGSGKTTLLRLLSGVIRPSKGRVEIFGRDARRMPRREIARVVAVVPQETTSVFPFTVEEIVLMGRFPHLGPYGFEGQRDIEAAREAMRLTDTLQFAERHIEDLSGGERQRVVIARALAQGSEILLLDEPTVFLDIRHELEIATLVKDLQRERELTVVAASHDLNLAAAVSDRLVLLKEGRVCAEGRSADVLREDILSGAYETKVTVGALAGRPFVAPDFSGIYGKDGGKDETDT